MSNHARSNPITASIDILFTFLIFWAFWEWRDVTTLESKVLLLFLYLIIINDWLSCRATYEFYTTEMFIIDVIIIFLFMRMVDSLGRTDSVARYDITFWFLLAGLSILYGIWDYIVCIYTKDAERKRGLKSWGNKMFVTGVLCAMSYIGLRWLQLHSTFRTPMFLVAEAPSFLVFVVLIVFWNKEKLQLYKELERAIGKRRKQ